MCSTSWTSNGQQRPGPPQNSNKIYTHKTRWWVGLRDFQSFWTMAVDYSDTKFHNAASCVIKWRQRLGTAVRPGELRQTEPEASLSAGPTLQHLPSCLPTGAVEHQESVPSVIDHFYSGRDSKGQKPTSRWDEGEERERVTNLGTEWPISY